MNEERISKAAEPPEPPLFILDLGSNGGVLAPTSVQELMAWLQHELNFWSWTQDERPGHHKGALDAAMGPLHNAINQTEQAANYRSQGNAEASQTHVLHARDQLAVAYGEKGLPHSTSQLGTRIHQLSSDRKFALAYLFPMLPTETSSGYQFDAKDLGSWAGFLSGLVDSAKLFGDVAAHMAAKNRAMDEVQARAERMHGDRREVLDELHREFSLTTQAINSAMSTQSEHFKAKLEEIESSHSDALEKHRGEMNSLRETFRESMTLRAPVEYWQSKAHSHNTKATTLIKVIAGSFGVTLFAVAILLWYFPPFESGKPEPLRLSLIALVVVLGVWAIRLVVRMFLSHTHLATDAEERVTMVKTYLAFLEGEKLPSDDDRKLILSALFRPATDGLVKDEGLPHPLLEAITRSGQK
ncbi:DUF6161 domain-containing protein [Acidovorax sp. NPDC077693]|uniref:DUF6161 domain-containing protein n=1 Tax=unclassified Acidovorax TaxID=2684926 RepID=UPI0037C513E5